MQSEVLASLRCDAQQLADLPMPGVRRIATRMVSEINAEIARPKPDAMPTIRNLRDIPTDSLLAEVRRRMTEARRIQRVCSKCHHNRVRAKELCMACYQRERKRKLKRAA